MESDAILKEEHGIAAIPERVIMKRGTYPKSW
jgi:hypothetical protein